MPRTRRALTWAVALAFGLALLGLGIYFFQIGLAKTEAVATILGAFAGLIGIALAVFALVPARSNSIGPGPAPQIITYIGKYIKIFWARDVTINNDDHA
jgi:uncharacterized membrane protein HdeD (DUF308 family)